MSLKTWTGIQLATTITEYENSLSYSSGAWAAGKHYGEAGLFLFQKNPLVPFLRGVDFAFEWANQP